MNAQSRAVPQAPDDKIPRRPMPQAAQQHRHEKVYVSAQSAKTISAQTDVEVIAEPGGKADVPAPPEISQVGGSVRQVEIDHDVESQQFRSEEHTSELQSQSNLVCRLLLEKKKKHR